MSRSSAAKKVEKHLEEKYGEEFVIEAVGGDIPSGRDWINVIFHFAADPELQGFAAVPKDGSAIHDYYTGYRVARDYGRSIEPAVAELIPGGRIFINTSMTHPAEEIGGPDMGVDEFVEKNPGSEFLISILTDAELTGEQVDAVLTQVGGIVAGTVPAALIYLAPVDAATYDEMVASPDTSEEQDITAKAHALVVIEDSAMTELKHTFRWGK